MTLLADAPEDASDEPPQGPGEHPLRIARKTLAICAHFAEYLDGPYAWRAGLRPQAALAT